MKPCITVIWFSCRWYNSLRVIVLPLGSTYIWLMFMVNANKYTILIHGSYGLQDFHHAKTRHKRAPTRTNLDLLVGCLEQGQTYSPKWWFNGEENPMGSESGSKNHQLNKQKQTGGWLNQPIWKICESQIGWKSSPGWTCENKKHI